MFSSLYAKKEKNLLILAKNHQLKTGRTEIFNTLNVYVTFMFS